MKKTIVALLWLAALAAHSAPLPPIDIDAMVAQIETVMTAGLCAVANDTADHGIETITLILPAPVGVRKILVNDYNWMREPGYAKASSGRFVMSERAVEACSADALSGRCLAFRSYWVRKFPSVQRPGAGVRPIPM